MSGGPGHAGKARAEQGRISSKIVPETSKTAIFAARSPKTPALGLAFAGPSMVGGMTTTLSTPGTTITLIAAAGPVATLAAMTSLQGSQWLDPSLLPLALVGVAVLWCPMLPSSVSAIVLGPWRDAAAPGVRGLARLTAVARELLSGPARQAVILNAVSWAVTAVIAAAAVAG